MNNDYAYDYYGGLHNIFKRKVWPIMHEMLLRRDGIPSNIIWVEGDQSRVAYVLDAQAGIDAILTTPNGLYGVACRVQVCSRHNPFNTFSIRSERWTGTKTELEKRLESQSNGSLTPYFTCQAYLDNTPENAPISFAYAKTADILNAIQSPELRIEKTNGDDGNKFVAVLFKNVPGVRGYIWPDPPPPAPHRDRPDQVLGETMPMAEPTDVDA